MKSSYKKIIIIITIICLIILLKLHIFPTPSYQAKWEIDLNQEVWEEPVYADRALYVAINKGELYKINSEGIIEWNIDFEAPIYAPITVQNESIIVGTGKIEENKKIYLLNKKGEIKWDYTLKSYGTLEYKSIIDDDGIIYIPFGHELISVDNGKLKWDKDFGEQIDGLEIGKNNYIYISTYNYFNSNVNKKIYALNTRGKIKWKFELEERVWTDIITDENGIMYFGDFGGNIYAVNSEGNVEWIYKLNNVPVGIARGKDGTIYITMSSDRHMHAISSRGEHLWSILRNSRGKFTKPIIDSEGNVIISNASIYKVREGKMVEYLHFEGGNSQLISGDDGDIYYITFEGKVVALEKKSD